MKRWSRWGVMFVLLCGVTLADATAAADTEELIEAAEKVESGEQLHSPLTIQQILTSTEFWGTIVNFFVLALLIGWVIRKKGNPALAARREEVQRELDEAQRLRLEAEAKQREATERLKRLDQEMAKIRADMAKAGEAERDRIVAQAEEKADRLRRDTTFLIEQQLKQLRRELTEEAAKAAVEAAHTLLAEQTSDADQTQLAEGYLKRLDEVAERQA